MFLFVLSPVRNLLYSDKQQVNCAGAVLGDLHRRRSAGFLPDGASADEVFCVASVQMFTLADHMFVAAETLLALQIVQSELHPNSQIWGPDHSGHGTKESLSIYGLFHQQACTPQGRNCLQKLFLRPTLNLDVIEERQRTISVLLRPENVEHIRDLTTVLRKVRNVRNALVQLRKGIGSASPGRSFDRSVWSTLMGFAAQCLKFRETVRELLSATDAEIIGKASPRHFPSGPGNSC